MSFNQKEYSRKYYENHKKEILSRTLQYYYDHKDHLIKKHVEWQRNNRDKVNASKNRQYRNGAKETIHRYKSRHKEAFAAYSLVSSALQSGRLVKPKNCSICSEEALIHGHHYDYMKPLEVVWVCQQCHSAIHKQMKLVKPNGATT